MQRGFCWTTSTADLGDYLGLWQHEIHSARNVPRSDWGEFWSWLVEHHIATPEDRAEFDRHFTDTARQTATPRPGLYLVRRWTLLEAETLDTRGLLVPTVRAALDEALITIGEPGLSA